MNKVSLFDKDTMFLIIFGLRGFKHELESRIGLRCASELLETFCTWPEISTVSMGVTVGISYCGIVGHTLRKEYSVLSVTVNKAARLMMAYPNIVSCDQKALIKSKMDLKHFTILPKVNMKGLRDIFAYEFKEVRNKTETEMPRQHELPILGRDDILFKFRRVLNAAVLNFNQDVKNLELIYQKLSCFVIKGDTQQGKTRLLDELFENCFHDGLNCLRISLCCKDSKIPFGVVSMILRRALKNKPEMSADDFQKNVLMLCKGLNVDKFLFLLNPHLKTNFAATETFDTFNASDISTIRQSMLKILINQTFKNFWIVFIDDIELMDQESFELLSYFLESNSIFMFLTLGHQRKLSLERKRFFDETFVALHRLEPIHLKFLTEIACNFLQVSAMSIQLEKYLIENSNGSPGWVETCVKSLQQAMKLEIVSMKISEAIHSGEVMKEQTGLESTSLMNKERMLFDRCYRHEKISHEEGEKLVNVAKLKNVHLEKEASVYERADHELMLYDSLTSYEQLVCKCGAVLGVEFKRHMLSRVLSCSTERMVGKAVMKLLELQIFSCGSFARGGIKLKSMDAVVCNCEDLKILDSCRDLPDYASCAAIKFQREGFRDVVYNLLTEKQRLDYHREALVYLHAETRRCDSCGNRQFRELINEDLDFNFHDGIVQKKDDSYESMINYFDSINFPITQSTRDFSKSRLQIRPLVLNYLNIDFHNCKCDAILYRVLGEMVTHCVGPKLFMKRVETKIELASKCIKIGNIPRANTLLQRAADQLTVSCPN